MPKFLSRIVALLLIPCLLADPSTAASLSNPPAPTPNIFLNQALAGSALHAVASLSKTKAKILRLESKLPVRFSVFVVFAGMALLATALLAQPEIPDLMRAPYGSAGWFAVRGFAVHVLIFMIVGWAFIKLIEWFIRKSDMSISKNASKVAGSLIVVVLTLISQFVSEKVQPTHDWSRKKGVQEFASQPSSPLEYKLSFARKSKDATLWTSPLSKNDQKLLEHSTYLRLTISGRNAGLVTQFALEGKSSTDNSYKNDAYFSVPSRLGQNDTVFRLYGIRQEDGLWRIYLIQGTVNGKWGYTNVEITGHVDQGLEGNSNWTITIPIKNIRNQLTILRYTDSDNDVHYLVLPSSMPMKELQMTVTDSQGKASGLTVIGEFGDPEPATRSVDDILRDIRISANLPFLDQVRDGATVRVVGMPEAISKSELTKLVKEGKVNYAPIGKGWVRHIGGASDKDKVDELLKKLSYWELRTVLKTYEMRSRWRHETVLLNVKPAEYDPIAGRFQDLLPSGDNLGALLTLIDSSGGVEAFRRAITNVGAVLIERIIETLTAHELRTVASASQSKDAIHTQLFFQRGDARYVSLVRLYPSLLNSNLKELVLLVNSTVGVQRLLAAADRKEIDENMAAAASRRQPSSGNPMLDTVHADVMLLLDEIYRAKRLVEQRAALPGIGPGYRSFVQMYQQFPDDRKELQIRFKEYPALSGEVAIYPRDEVVQRREGDPAIGLHEFVILYRDIHILERLVRYPQIVLILLADVYFMGRQAYSFDDRRGGNFTWGLTWPRVGQFFEHVFSTLATDTEKHIPQGQETHYGVLGIEKNAKPDQIRDAYVTKAMQYFPTLNTGNPEAQAKFQKIERAYMVLSDAQKRAEYDAEIGADSLDMTWLARLVEWALKPFAKGDTGSAKDEWVYQARIRIVPHIEQAINAAINIAFPQLGTGQAFLLGFVFGEAHTDRPRDFKIFAGLWGYASLMAMHSAGLLHIGPIHGWVFQLATYVLLSSLQIKLNQTLLNRHLYSQAA